MTDNGIFAEPRTITRLEDCHFYHTLDLPGYGRVEGQWDLRGKLEQYLGGVDFSGKRVLDLGTANGCLTFHMESCGADVVSFDLGPANISANDIGPSRYNLQQYLQEYDTYVQALNNGYWLAHGALQSRARMVYGTIYAVPEQIGPVDMSVFGCILLHLRDPFFALKNALRLTRETVIVAEPLWQGKRRWLDAVWTRIVGPYMRFLPEYWKAEPQMTWWSLPAGTVQRFLVALGFEDSKITYHTQKFRGTEYTLYTVVAHRTNDYGLLSQEPKSIQPGSPAAEPLSIST